MIITIDGPAGTGKSTVAKKLADQLGITYFDTGALYRAISWKILDEGVSPSDLKGIEKVLGAFNFEIQVQGVKKHYFVAGVDVTEKIRSVEVTSVVSEVSAYKVVRDALKPIQVAFAEKNDAVFEGRDIGTAVFPHAQHKFFLTASDTIRAKRRLADLQSRFPERASTFSYDEILKGIQERDHYDSNREVAPLKKADDAILIDTSSMTIDEVIKEIERYL